MFWTLFVAKEGETKCQVVLRKTSENLEDLLKDVEKYQGEEYRILIIRDKIPLKGGAFVIV